MLILLVYVFCVFLPDNNLSLLLHYFIVYKSHPFPHLHFLLHQMDPKLRPSFPDIVRHLEEILARLKVEEMHECVPLSGDNDKKTIPKGKSTAQNLTL